MEQIQLWADVTLAAMEHKGPSFFRRSPEAFFVDNLQNAVRGKRTPPEWFWSLRKEEQQRRADHARRMRNHRQQAQRKSAAPDALLADRPFDLDENPDDLTADLVAYFLAAGQAKPDALRNARRFTEEYVGTRPCQKAK